MSFRMPIILDQRTLPIRDELESYGVHQKDRVIWAQAIMERDGCSDFAAYSRILTLERAKQATLRLIDRLLA